jgi:hypothetical protein
MSANVIQSSLSMQRRAFCIYDQALTPARQGADATESGVASAPYAVSLTGLTPAMAGVIVQVKLHSDADWLDYQTIDTASETQALVEFAIPYNFVKVIGLAAGARVFTQE